MKKILFFVFILLLITPVFAIPSYQDLYVNDYANVFTSNQTSQLRSLLISVEQETTAEISVLTVDTVESSAMSQYAQEVFDNWKIGKTDKDNGLLILYSKEEDRIWVTTGYGLGGILPDSKVGRILDETFVIERANNNSANGIVLATQVYADVIIENKDEVLSGQASSNESDGTEYVILFYLLIFIIPTSLSYFKKHPKCPDCKGRMSIIETRTVYEDKKTMFGTTKIPYIIVTYRCKKCNKIVTKKMKRDPRRPHPIIFLGGLGGRGGIGGFGGGGSGGGGAGR
ncbi:MAG: TPM domain-containing protein [Nanoarchaeota archaeon]|nr:TPM domain-containing protein [Nanoarchaeota archaeon]